MTKMIDDVNDVNNEQDNQEQEQSPDKSNSNNLEEVVRSRLAREQKKAAQQLAQQLAEKDAVIHDMQAKMEELTKKISTGNATQQEVQQHSQMNQIQNTPGMPPEQIAAIQQQAIDQQKIADRHKSFHDKLTDAQKKDPEFKQLIDAQHTPGNPHIPSTAWSAFEHLDNAPAVIKQLLKSKKDYALLTASSTKQEAVKFINELSDRLENNQPTPHPSHFEPDPDISDVGDSQQPYSGVDRWKKRNGMK